MHDDVDRRTTLGVILGGLASASPVASHAKTDATDAGPPLDGRRSSALQAAIDHVAASGQIGGVDVPGGKMLSPQTIVMRGDYHGGLTVTSPGAEIGGGTTTFRFGGLQRPAPEYRLNARIGGISLTGPGKTVRGSAAVAIDDTADVLLRDGIYRGYDCAIRSTGGLLWDASNLTLRDSGYGIVATNTASFAPNSINLYSLRIIKNDLAIHTKSNPNGIINAWGCEIEDNNAAGDARDGRKVVFHEKAGTINYIGSHFESNNGQYNLYYSGADSSKNLLILGCQVIAGAGEQVHLERGRGSFIASRITASERAGIVFGEAASGTVIDCEADISGPGIGSVAALRDGRLAFGANPVSPDPLISATPAAVQTARGVVARWQSDQIRIEFCRASGTMNGYLQTSLGDHHLHNSNDDGGWVIAAGGRPVLHVGRSGHQAIEGSAPNATLCGTAALPWAGGHTRTAFNVTSDRRAKRDIRPISERERAVALRCKDLLRAFRLTVDYEERGDKAVTHYGLIAQDVIEVFRLEGLDALATGIVRHDCWPGTSRAGSADGSPVDGEPAGDLYSINYEQLYALLLSAL